MRRTKSIKRRGGISALNEMYSLKKELIQGQEEEEKAAYAYGQELPLMPQEALRTKVIVDEMGLFNIISSAVS